MNSNGGSSFFGSDWLGAFLIIAILFGGGLGWGGNRGPAPDVATKEYVQDAVNFQGISGQLQQIALSSADNNYQVAQLLNGQTRDLMQMGYTNQINAMAGFNQLTQQIAQLGYQMDQCCCSVKTQLLQDKYDEAIRELNKEQGEKIAANTAAYVLNVMGKWVANAPAAAA
jgi:hypothetical protein